MTFLKVLLIVLLVLWLISLIRLGARVKYGEAGLYVTALAGPLNIQILPMKPKKRTKPKKEKKPKKKKPAKEKKPKADGKPGTLSRLMKLLPIIGQACGSLKRKIRIDDLELELIWGGSDPASIALGYGQANAALGMLWPIFDNNFKVKRSNFEISMDYGRSQPAVELQAAVTMTIGQIMVLGVHYGVKALFTWIKSGRPAVKRQEVLTHE